MEEHIYVFIELAGVTSLVGQLWMRNRGGRETASFEYDQTWLDNPQKFALEPALYLGRGAQHTNNGQKVFGAMGDSAPDRWGRKLMIREEARRAAAEGRAVRTLMEADCLLMVNDFSRAGALRFAKNPDGPFLSDQGPNIPPLIRLPALLQASDRILAERETDEDLRLLLMPGTSLGGARPKASVLDNDGSLSIAKFPSNTDEFNIGRWEMLALNLAEQAGIDVPQRRLETIAGRDVLILRRFDREGTIRIPFLSAMSMIGAQDNEAHSYLDILDAIRQYGARARDDSEQLWRRIAFNILISNVDDHLRNHAFLSRGAGGWVLSPAYDLNPVPAEVRPRILSLAIDETNTTASLEVAYGVAESFGIPPERAREIAREVATATARWRERAQALNLPGSEIARMASAFEHEDLRLALDNQTI